MEILSSVKGLLKKKKKLCYAQLMRQMVHYRITSILQSFQLTSGAEAETIAAVCLGLCVCHYKFIDLRGDNNEKM